MNKNISSREIRETFLSFFEQKSHLRIPGASVVPADDPTLLFINSGMAPLKKYFVGEATPPASDLCNVQPSIRTRDIDDVGDRHHLTFFEMLGSWSVNNYFKERAIELAFELLADKFGFPPSHLYATVFKGSPDLNLPADEESARAWEKVGLRRDQIVFLGEDNFWGPAGDVGPCGPCTEVFFDTGEQYGKAYRSGEHFDTASRYIEIWNAGVFMEFNKKSNGTFVKLPFHSVDTGSGLERMAMTMNGNSTVYETDLLKPFLDLVSGQFAGNESSSIREHRIITDHLRALTFILSEGVVPSNEGRGYIPRRLIRKCIALTARSGARNFEFVKVLNAIADCFAEFYPQIGENRKMAVDLFLKEKGEFDKVVGRGLERLEHLCSRTPLIVSGEEAFALFSTYGIPLELTREFIRERGGAVEESGYASEFEKHQAISRAGGKQLTGIEHLDALTTSRKPTRFVGYDELEASAKVLEIITLKDKCAIILDTSVCYAEMGGQVGDAGVMSGGSQLWRIVNTQKSGSTWLHFVEGGGDAPVVGNTVTVAVDRARRCAIQRHHTVTHLLHWALHEIVGRDVSQKGSFVGPDKLTFDFNSAPLTPEQLTGIEKLVNERILENASVNWTEVPHAEVKNRKDVMQFFGDKYGDIVRIVQIGGDLEKLDGYSMELCGGTHTRATGEIGFFRIVGESAIAAGVRRVEAVAGLEAWKRVEEEFIILKTVAGRVNSPFNELETKIESLLVHQKELEKQLRAMSQKEAAGTARDLVGKVTIVNDTPAIIENCGPADGDTLQSIADVLKGQFKGVIVLGGIANNAVNLVAAVTSEFVTKAHAGKIIQTIAPIVGGKGGGRPDNARGGGKHLAGLDEALAKARSLLLSNKK